jgi:hypothetical protein
MLLLRRVLLLRVLLPAVLPNRQSALGQMLLTP